MDAATLRIILLVLGTLLLVAMYLWERRRSQERADERFRPARRKPPAPAARREPRFDASAGDDAESTGGTAAARNRPATRPGGQGDDPGGADSTAVAGVELGDGRGSGRSLEPRRGRPQPPDTRSRRAPSAESDSEPLLVQLFVVAVDDPFDGTAVQSAVERQHLTPGEMAIYHRLMGESPASHAQFSMANLVEPGTFPFDAMDSFATPGLALFAQFDGRTSDLMVYDELIRTARELADELAGEVHLPGRIMFDDSAREFLRRELLSLIDERADSLTPSAQGAGAEPSAASRQDLSGERGASAFKDPSSSQRR